MASFLESFAGALPQGLELGLRAGESRRRGRLQELQLRIAEQEALDRQNDFNVLGSFSQMAQVENQSTQAQLGVLGRIGKASTFGANSPERKAYLDSQYAQFASQFGKEISETAKRYFQTAKPEALSQFSEIAKLQSLDPDFTMGKLMTTLTDPVSFGESIGQLTSRAKEIETQQNVQPGTDVMGLKGIQARIGRAEKEIAAIDQRLPLIKTEKGMQMLMNMRSGFVRQMNDLQDQLTSTLGREAAESRFVRREERFGRQFEATESRRQQELAAIQRRFEQGQAATESRFQQGQAETKERFRQRQAAATASASRGPTQERATKGYTKVQLELVKVALKNNPFYKELSGDEKTILEANIASEAVAGTGSFQRNVGEILGRITKQTAQVRRQKGLLSRMFGSEEPPVRITTDAQFNALESGTEFIGPDGKRRRKP